MLFRLPVEKPPENDPEKTDRAGDDERLLPAVRQGDPRHDERRDDRADIAPGVEDAGREGAFLPREPLRYRLNGSREVPRLADAEGETRGGKSHNGSG